MIIKLKIRILIIIKLLSQVFFPVSTSLINVPTLHDKQLLSYPPLQVLQMELQVAHTLNVGSAKWVLSDSQVVLSIHLPFSR